MISLKQVSDLEELQSNLVRVKQESSNIVSFYQGDVRVVSVNLTQPSALKGEKGDPGLSVNELAGQPDDSWRQGQQGDMGDTGAKGNKGIPGVDAVVNDVILVQSNDNVSWYENHTLFLPAPVVNNRTLTSSDTKFVLDNVIVEDSDDFSTSISWDDTRGTLHLSFPPSPVGAKGVTGITDNGVTPVLESCKLVILADGEPWSCEKTEKDNKISYVFKVSPPAKGLQGDSGNGILRKVNANATNLCYEAAPGFASFTLIEGVPVVKILSEDSNSFSLTGEEVKVTKEKWK